MQGLRFNHVYLGLLCICALSAFLLPRFVDPARAQVQNIFAPVSHPAELIGHWFHRHDVLPDPASPDTPRPDENIRFENEDLRAQVASLSTQLQKLLEREAEFGQLGKLRDLCKVFSVAAGDSGTTESLLVNGTNLEGLQQDMAVVFPGGLAGRLNTPGLTGTRVRLITDNGFRVTGMIKRYVTTKSGATRLVPIATDPFLVCGDGNNTMHIEGLAMDKATEIQMNDLVLLDDQERWPMAVQGQPIGRVIAAPVPSRRAPGFAEIKLQPATNLMRLREVMVVTKAKY